ncbi:hypothetical protein SDRG_05514 [Saprolegnia diclina VS20]|uniref:Uncharacterized protein n=1 Tax=Saprolegnia diclina (strain VS20) TaxID=1156394 RepID=T0QTE4_SAPDV|nr:hypothetical protein SDRG_05514 [Saprolegnia diclina VS20]EQC37290.1 hypothetical protein SDRG_05514 [Saprolegnia diclina VS20]|eukprot:XP_008609452.1 hypothetical protein SDRG_05514 [Saprolegnia diclina VS20]
MVMSLAELAQRVRMPQCVRCDNGASSVASLMEKHMSVGGVDVTWPLSPASLAALSSQLANHATVVIDSAVPPDFADANQCHKAVHELVGSTASNRFEFAHVAIDSVGSALALTPATYPAEAFATLVYFLPSDSVGGAVTISCDSRTTTYDALDGHTIAFFNACAVSVAPIVSGHRGVVVYHAVYEPTSLGTRLFGPPSLPSIDYLERAIVKHAGQPHVAVAAVLETPCTAPSFGTLGGRDKALVDWLLAKKRFDVAFVRAGGRGNALENAAFMPESFHPACKTPAIVRDACRDRPLKALIDLDVGATLDVPAFHAYLVFWPKMLRVCVLGFDRTLRLLDDAVRGDVDDDLGYGSTRELIVVATRYLLSDVHKPSLRTDTVLLTLASALNTYGDAVLVNTFLMSCHWREFDAMADEIATAEARRYRATQSLLLLHHLRDTTSMTFRLDVLSRLLDAVPEARHQVRTIALAWWQTMLQKLRVQNYAPDTSLLVDGMRLEACLDRTLVAPEAEATLATRLPSSVVAAVLSFLQHTPRLVTVMALHPRGTPALPAALWALPSTPMHLRHAYLALAIDRFCVLDAEHDAGVAYLVLLTAGTSMDATVARAARKKYASAAFQGTLAVLLTTALTPHQAVVANEWRV